MKEAEKEKYLGDMVYQTSSIQATIVSNKSKGQGINTGIKYIFYEMLMGKHKKYVAMKLKEVMLINGILYNS